MQSLFTVLVPYLTSPITWISFILGACMGSFFNVCIYRIPKRSFWHSQRSHCPHCQQVIPLWHNLPILSWLFLRGKSACCGKPISIQYPLVELATAIAFVAIYWEFPFIVRYDQGLVLDAAETIRYFHGVAFFSLLFICSVIDLHLQIIPDVLSLPMLALTPAVVFFHPELDWVSALVGVVAGGGSLYLTAIAYYYLRKDVGLGMGDVKLLAAIGGWLGYQSIIPTLFIGSISGAIVGIGVIIATRSFNLKVKIPFGPFLSLGAMMYLLYGQQINEFLFYRE